MAADQPEPCEGSCGCRLMPGRDGVPLEAALLGSLDDPNGYAYVGVAEHTAARCRAIRTLRETVAELVPDASVDVTARPSTVHGPGNLCVRGTIDDRWVGVEFAAATVVGDPEGCAAMAENSGRHIARRLADDPTAGARTRPPGLVIATDPHAARP